MSIPLSSQRIIWIFLPMFSPFQQQSPKGWTLQICCIISSLHKALHQSDLYNGADVICFSEVKRWSNLPWWSNLDGLELLLARAVGKSSQSVPKLSSLNSVLLQLSGSKQNKAQKYIIGVSIQAYQDYCFVMLIMQEKHLQTNLISNAKCGISHHKLLKAHGT